MRPSRLVPSVACLVLGLSALAARPVASSAPDKPSPADLAWMTGRWVAEHDGMFFEESWGPPAQDGLVGTFRMAAEGETSMYELMCVEQDRGGPLVLRLRHFSRGLVPWKDDAVGGLPYTLVELGETRAVFENGGSDDMRRFVYARDGDTLAISLVRPAEDGSPDVEHAETFTLTLAR